MPDAVPSIAPAVEPAVEVVNLHKRVSSLEVLKGMTETLRAPGLRGVFVEVHFLALAQRGMRAAPVEIQKILQQAGFDVFWTDASHIAGLRKSTLNDQRDL